MRINLALVAAAAVSVGLLAPAGAGEVVDVGALELEDALFWDGVEIEHAEVSSEADCGREGPCWEYTFDILEPGHQLRVAIDIRNRSNRYRFSLRGPSGGELVGLVGGGTFSRELYVPTPQPGRWRITVVPTEVTEGFFRMRAKLEDVPTQPEPGTPLPPNLVVVPPHEFGFTAPVTWLPFPWNDPPPLEVAGVAPTSCLPDETAEHLAIRCLRFSAGLGNSGPGPLDLRFSPFTDVTGEPTMYQALHYAGTSQVTLHEAGTYEYHFTHAHYHYTDFNTYELWHVTDAETGAMEQVGHGQKAGFCVIDQKIADFSRFDHDPYRTYTGGDCLGLGSQGASMGLSSGWADVYRWQRAGQYVEFFGQPDGRYVVRVIADAAGRLIEVDDTDNVGYAYIEVEGDDITLLERGWGSDPWDPAKTLWTDWHR
jgi:hypothetical protein